MSDIFAHTILCAKCNTKMKPVTLEKNGFHLRAMQCQKCNEKIIHPSDMEEYDKFNSLKHKQFRVKLRFVGNSYAVSIPREIINFINAQESIIDEHEKIMHKLVSLCFEDFGKLSLNFNEIKENQEED